MGWTPYRRQLGCNGQVGCDRLCSRLGDAIGREIQLLQLASLVLTQRVADSNGALIFEPIGGQPASKRASLSDCYILKYVSFGQTYQIFVSEAVTRRASASAVMPSVV